MTESASTNSALLTKALLLHPVALVLALLAFGLCISHDWVGGLAAFIVACVTWALTLTVMAINFTLYVVRVLSLCCRPFFEPPPSMTHANTLL